MLSEISLSPVSKSTAEFWASVFDEEDVELSWSQLIKPNPLARSAFKSSMFSRPTAIRINPSEIPAS